MTLGMMTLVLHVVYAVLQKALYAECHYAECRYAECRGAIFWLLAFSML
jgi:hypothetical protein